MRHLPLAIIIVCLVGLVYLPGHIYAQSLPPDLNNDTRVDYLDINHLIKNVLQFTIFHYNTIAKNFGLTLTPSVTPNQPPLSTPWYQHAHDAQHSGYTSETVTTPWRWKWAWNGPTSSGGLSKTTTGGTLPRNVQPVTGNNLVYVAAGTNGIYALSQTTGAVVWNKNPGGSINSTAAYHPGTNAVFAVSTNGYLYKLDAGTGNTLASFNGSGTGTSTLPLPPSIHQNTVFFVMGTMVYALNTATLQPVWSYTAGDLVESPPAYSINKNLVIVVTRNLTVHGIKNLAGGSGTTNKSWTSTVISSVYSGGNPGSASCNLAEIKNGWPVIADSVGTVFIKLRLCWQKLWDPNTTALYGINMSDGTRAFSNLLVGAGGYGDGDYLPIGPQPVIRTHDNGKQVMYTIIRGRIVNDVRWDSHFGQIALENNVVSGLTAGQIREVPYQYPAGATLNNTYLLTDEQPYVSMAGDYLFGGHWMAGLSLKMSNPLTSSLTATNTDTIISSTVSCANSTSHYCSTNLTQTGDSRTFTKGFYLYYNQSGVYDRYWSGEYADWIVSNNLILYRSIDGAIVALENGNPTAQAEAIPEVAGVTSEENLITTAFTVNYSLNNGKHIILSTHNPHQGHFKVLIDKAYWLDIFGTETISIGANPLPTVFPPGINITISGQQTYYQGDPVIRITSANQLTLNLATP